MTTYDDPQLRTEDGRWRGFLNVFQMENRKWWAGKSPFLRGGIWVLILDGLLAGALFILPTLTGPEGEQIMPGDALQSGSEMFVGLSTLAIAVGIIILMQDTIIEEKQSGTAAWVLSKPVSRSSFILAKLAANFLGMVVLMLVLPGVVAYGLFQLYEPGAVELSNFIGMMGVVGLHSLFYLALTLLMGVVANGRGLLLAVTLGSLLGGGLVPIEALVRIAPWQLPQIGLLVLQGLPVGSFGLTMMAATAVWSVLFLIAAVWRFDRVAF